MKPQKRALTIVISGLLASLTLFLLVWLLTARPAEATTCDVPSGTHPTIQSAMDDASCDTVELAAGVYMENVTVGRSVQLEGQTAGNTMVNGGGTGSVFIIQSGIAVTLANMTITNGHSSVAGGGIWVSGASLTISNIVIAHNAADGTGGGLYAFDSKVVLFEALVTGNESDEGGGGINVWGLNGTLTMVNSTVSHNASVGNCTCNIGGALYSVAADVTISDSMIFSNTALIGGGLFNYVGDLTVIGSTIESNNAAGVINDGGILTVTQSTIHNNQGNGIYNGYSTVGEATAVVIDSTIKGNNASAGAGIYSGFNGSLFIMGSAIVSNTAVLDGGGILMAGTVEGDTASSIVNSTISGNTVTSPSGSGGGILNVGRLSLTQVTIAGNSAAEGAGLYHVGDNPPGSVLNLANSIMADNLVGSDCHFGGASGLTSLGNNIDSDGSCDLTAAKDLPATDPMLAPLRNNGGPTWTQALLAGSPAIDAANDDDCPATDQRGAPRPVDGDGDNVAQCDIGAYEYVPPIFSSWVYLPLVVR